MLPSNVHTRALWACLLLLTLVFAAVALITWLGGAPAVAATVGIIYAVVALIALLTRGQSDD